MKTVNAAASRSGRKGRNRRIEEVNPEKSGMTTAKTRVASRIEKKAPPPTGF
jgi:hypothetical protein